MIKFPVEDVLLRFKNARSLLEGGQKKVFLVDDPKYGEVVLKVGCCASQSAMKRISREVSILLELDSRYFSKHLYFEALDGNRFFTLEEFIKGKTLNYHFTDYAAESGVLGLMSELVKGLQILWERRIVHRDLKPQNIIITSKGPVIIDLGIARVLDLDSLTQTYAPFGPCTPDYASPEQLRNRKRDIDHRSDQFSLGVVIAQLILSGGHPFDPRRLGGDSVPHNILSGNWAKAAIKEKVSSHFFTALERLLGVQPYQRFRTAGELLVAFRIETGGAPK